MKTALLAKGGIREEAVGEGVLAIVERGVVALLAWH